MNLKSIISLLNPISFWRMDKYGGDNIYDDYNNNTLINHNCTLGEDGSTNVNLGDVSTNIRGGYIDHTDTGFLNDLVANQTLHISFNFKCPEKIVGIRPIVSKWFPENQWFLGFENGILVGKVQTDSGLVEVQIDHDEVLYNNRWNHCSFMIYNDEIRIDVNGNSNYVAGVVDKNIVNTPIIGINSPFLIGGKDSYIMTQDFYITDLAITQKSPKTLNNDIQPLYILTRDVEERFLDLAPDYYFNIAESFSRGDGLNVRNKGTLGNQIYGYLAGTDIENFSLVENDAYTNEQRVLMPTNTYFVIADTLELDLIGDETTNIIFDYNMPKFTNESRVTMAWKPFNLSNVNSSWRMFRLQYQEISSVVDWNLRYYHYTYNEAGTQLQNDYTADLSGRNPDELDEYYTQNGIWWEKCGKIGTQEFKLKQNTENDSFRYSYGYTDINAGYVPPTNQTFTVNYFFYTETMPNNSAMSLGKMALIKRKLNSYAVAQLKAVSPKLIYKLLQSFGVFTGWYSGVTDENDMKHMYNYNAMDFAYSTSNVEYFKHNDVNTNRLNKWNTTLRGVSGLDANIQTLQSTMLQTRNFIWNFFTESLTTAETYIITSYREYNDHATRFLTFYANSLNGEYSPGNVEVRFENTFIGSFSTATPLSLGGYHMITLTRNADYYELYIDGKLESHFSTGYTHDIDGNVSAEFAVDWTSTLSSHYMNDISCVSDITDVDDFKPMIEFMFRGYHHKITGTSYLQGTPIQSNIHTIESDSLKKIQTNLTDTNGNFAFDLPKSQNSSGKYLLSLPVNENATSNVVVHGPYQTSVTYDQITEEPLLGEEVYDMTLDFDPLMFYPMNEIILPIEDDSGNNHDATGFTGSDYILNEPAFEDQSASINFNSGTTYLDVPTTGLFNNISVGFTMNCWIKKNITQSHVSIFHISSTQWNTSDVITLFHKESNNTWNFEVGDSILRSISNPLTIGSWTMVTLRINQDNTHDLLIGGKVLSHDTNGSPAVIDRIVGRIGYIIDGVGIQNEDTNISNFSIFSYPLPNEELEKMANKGKGHNANTLKSAITYDTPMAYYTFDARKELIEEISNYDLTVNGSVDFNKNSVIVNRDVVGNNYMFNTDYKLLPVASGGSIEFGFKTTGNHTQSILLSEWNENNGEGSYKFQLEAGDILKCYLINDATFMETTALTQNEWHLVILTIVNGNICNLYVDNVLQDSITLLPLTPAIDYDVSVNALLPLAYYRFNDSIAQMVDETTNYPAVYENDPILDTAGLLTNSANTAIFYDGVDQYSSFTTQFITELQTHLVGSVSFLASFPTSGEVGIYFADDTSNDQDFILSINESKAKFTFKVDGAVAGVDNFTRSTDRTFTANTTYHIVFVQDDTEGVLIYINGTLESTSTTFGTVSDKWFDNATGIINGNINFYDRLSPLYYSGTMDELTFHDDRLTEEEITGLYKSSKNLGGGHGTPVYGLDRMTIGSDSQGNVLGQLASPTWFDDVAFYHKVLSEVRRDYHYQYFVNKKELLVGDL